MAVAIDKSKCPHDHPCPLIRVCPVNAISQDKQGYPVIDYDICIGCDKCAKYCPMHAMKILD